MAYAQRAIQGFSWTSLAKFLITGLVLVKVAIISRLLTPSQMGLFSLTTIALGLMESFTETGINVTIIQSKQSVEYFLDTAWVISIMRGFIIGSLMIFIGVLMQWWYSEPQLLYLVSIAALVPVVRGFINPAIITFHKQMQFWADGSYRVILSLVETLFAIAIVWVSRSVFGLIIAMIIAGLFEVGLTFLLFKTKPHFSFIGSRAKTIFANAKGLTLSSALSYLNENLDNLLLGKILGSRGLGLYHNGYTIGHKTYDITKSVHHSTLPAYIAMAHDKPRLKKAFLKTSGITLFGLLIISSPLLFFPKFVVSLILGQQWLDLVPVLPILTIAGIIQSMHMLSQTVFYSTKAYKYVYTSLCVAVCTLLIALPIFSLQWGLEGAAISIILTRLTPLPIIAYGLYRELA